MQITFFSFLMSLLWFNLYILIINIFRKNDKFIISFNILPIIFFMSLSIVRLIFNFEISGAVIIRSKNIFPVFYNLIKNPLNLNGYIITLSEILIFSWILVAIILLINGIYKYMGFRRKLERLSNDSSKESMELFNKVLKKIKLENKIEIVQNKNIYSPFVIGILKAKIYIPNISFSEKELEYIILHEANHFLKRDSLKKILIQGLKYLFWWNPFAHLFANNFNHILEIQCDLETTADFTDDEKIRYLETITKIIKNPRANITKSVSVPNLLNLEDIDSLKQRFKIILNYKKKTSRLNMFNIGICSLALLIFASSYLIIIQPYYTPNDDEIYQEEETDNSFILERLNGSYDIYINNFLKYNIRNLDDLSKNLHGLPIYKEEEE